MTKTLFKLNTQARLLSSSVYCGALIFANTAVLSSSASAEDFTLEEIVVTAQKREQSLQEVPISISALVGDKVEKMGVNNGVDVAKLVPGLVANGTAASDQRFAIRGVGSLVTNIAGAETSVGVYQDSVYSGQTYLSGTNFFDIERIEVVKGPQGTLFGRNTSAGAISVTSKKADREQTYLNTKVGVGTEAQRHYEAIANYSTSEDWGLRVGVQVTERDGTFKNVLSGNEINNADDLIFRVGFQRDWSDSFRADFKLDYVESDARVGVLPLGTDYERSASLETTAVQPSDKLGIEIFRGNMTLAYDLNDSLKLTSITAFLDGDLNVTSVDNDGTPLSLLFFRAPAEHFNFSQEFRLNASTDSVDWFVGASVFYEDSDLDIINTSSDFDFVPIISSFPGFPLGPIADCAAVFGPLCNTNAQESAAVTNETWAYGLYADATWQVTDKLSLTLGARYSYDDKEASSLVGLGTGALNVFSGGNFLFNTTPGKVRGTETWSAFTPRVAVAYQFNNSVMGHASVNLGYKAGGFNAFPLTVGNTELRPYEEEEVVSYEIGIKSDFADGRARLNVAAFLLDYENFQYEDTQANGVPITRTIDEAQNIGFEIEAVYLAAEGLELNLGYQYLDSEIEDSGVGGVAEEGSPLPYAPRHSATLRGSYEFSTEWGLVDTSVIYNYVDDQHLNPEGNRIVFTPSHYTVDVRVGLTADDEKWSVALIGENITDERWFQQIEEGLAFFVGYPNVGKLWRAEVTYRFD